MRLTDEDILRPSGSLGSLSSYLSGLKDDDMVTVVTQVGRHGLFGMPGNAAHTKERQLFVEFIIGHRSPTGRTQDSSSRYHGAEYHLTSNITQIKTQSGRTTPDPDAVLELIFKKALEGHGLKPPSGSSVATWLAEDFGLKSKHGHTVIFPHKTDACAVCSSFDIDIQSLEMSIKRNMQQNEDAGSIERQANTLPCTLPYTRRAPATHAPPCCTPPAIRTPRTNSML